MSTAMIGLPNSVTALRCRAATIKAAVIPRQLDNEPSDRLTSRFVAFESKGPYRGLKRFAHYSQGFRRKDPIFRRSA
jgi:hypothetical protein